MRTHSLKSFRHVCFHLAVILLSHCCISTAQRADSVAPAPSALYELEGFTQTFYYSPEHLVRAIEIASLVEHAGIFFQNEIKFTPSIEMYILAPIHWSDIAAGPLKNVYGFPHNIDHVRLAVAAEDNEFWRSFLPPVDQLPPVLAAQITAAYGKADGTFSMMPFFDLLALHEMGHSYTEQAGLKMHRKWMSELFVNIMLHTYIAEMQPHLLPALETFPDMVIQGGTTEYTYTSLEDFERLYESLGMSPKNYGWYQCMLHSKAKEIYNEGGKSVLHKLWKALKTHRNDMNDEEFLQILKDEVHPAVADVYEKWNRE